MPGYLHARLEQEHADDRETLEKDFQLAAELGFKAEFVESVPYAFRPGVRFESQAKFHPLKYLGPLLERIDGDGSYEFERTEASEIESNPLTVHAGRFKVRCSYLVIATHTPLVGKTGMLSATLFQSKLMLYTSYVLGTTLPAGALPEALWWNTTDPYYYLRVDRHPDHRYLIFGGKDEKTGQEKGPKFEAS